MIRHLCLSLFVALVIGVPAPLAQERFLGKTASVWAGQLKSSRDAKERRSAAFARPPAPAKTGALPMDALFPELRSRVTAKSLT